MFKNKIDRLVAKRDRLKLLEQKRKSSVQEINSAIETKIAKLENKAYQNRTALDTELNNIYREIEKTERAIESEKIYVNSADENKRNNKTESRERRSV